MRELCERARLVAKPIVEQQRSAVRPQGLDRDLTSEHVVDRFVDLAHRTGSERFRHTVAAEGVRLCHAGSVARFASRVSLTTRAADPKASRMTSLRSGQIQKHGALLAVDEHDLAIVAASENGEAILGAVRVVGGGLVDAIALPNERTLRDLIAGELDNTNPVDVRTHDGRVLDAMLHRAHGLVIFELEPATSRVPLGRISHALARVHAAQGSVTGALMELKTLTGMATVELRAH